MTFNKCTDRPVYHYIALISTCTICMTYNNVYYNPISCNCQHKKTIDPFVYIYIVYSAETFQVYITIK